MSSVPTPQSDRRRTLRSHSRAQASAPIEEETSDEGDITQYAEATEHTRRKPLSWSHPATNAETHHESEDGTPSPRATHTSGASPIGSSMPRMGPDGTISMTFEDLMAFCDRMNARRNDNNNYPWI
ncbi:hypothetical protein ACJ73_05289 [Blastomyces percursus]|uniref:Uncharacterized protein n=1 Tax=Blastomyces percursus TaxID=1658174 RepID=A0A1J9R4C7_9EURO|nr:hypothetical protein ACJ73_05289 [Blastomyces percursus]